MQGRLAFSSGGGSHITLLKAKTCGQLMKSSWPLCFSTASAWTSPTWLKSHSLWASTWEMFSPTVAMTGLSGEKHLFFPVLLLFPLSIHPAKDQVTAANAFFWQQFRVIMCLILKLWTKIQSLISLQLSVSFSPHCSDLCLMGTLNVAFFSHEIFKEYTNRKNSEMFYNLHLKSRQVNMDMQVMKL